MAEKTKKKDFVEIKYSGYTNNQLFDSNIPEDLKVLDDKAKPEKTLIIIGEKMVVPGLDKQLEDKEIGKEYEVTVDSKEAFGQRDRNLIKIIALKAFHEQKVDPRAGMVLTLNNQLVKIIAVSGARVTADFNHPLASKNVRYKVTIERKVTDEKEKVEALLKFYFQYSPEFEIKDNKVIVKGPKILEQLTNFYKEKFKELSGKELTFEEKKPEPQKTRKKEEKSENTSA